MQFVGPAKYRYPGFLQLATDRSPNGTYISQYHRRNGMSLLFKPPNVIIQPNPLRLFRLRRGRVCSHPQPFGPDTSSCGIAGLQCLHELALILTEKGR